MKIDMCGPTKYSTTMTAILSSICLVISVFISSSAACNCPIQEVDICNKCTCSLEQSQMVINCKNSDLTQVPTFIYSSYEYQVVTLADNQITSIPAEKFRELRALKKLDMTGNAINSIELRAFSGLNNTLEELLLEVNQMTVFPKAALSVLTKLATLRATGFDLSVSGLPSGALEYLNQLVVLHLSSNRLRTLGEDALSGQGSSLEELNLDGNLLTAVPTQALARLQSLEYLSLIGNAQITSIPAGAFQGSNIMHLDLSQIGFTSLHAAAFDGLEGRLKNLTMRSCQFKDDMLPALQDLSTLQDLELSQNNLLANIPDNFFSAMTQLQILTLHGCSVHTLRPQTLAGLGNLKELDINGNRLTSVSPDTFTSIPSLQSLDLGSNANLANQLAQDIFNPIASSLEILSLENTGFTNSHWALLDDLTNLRSLRLTSNQISALQVMGFSNKKFLTAVYLDTNQLTDLTQTHLYGPNTNLKSINFNLNSLTTLNKCVFHDFTVFDYYNLNLNSNPLHCDCQMKWLLQKLKENPQYDFLKYSLNWKCNTPDNLKDKYFAQELQESDLVCDSPVTEAPCLDLSPSSTTSFTSSPASSSMAPPGTELPYFFNVNITFVTDVEMSVYWKIGNADRLAGFRVEHWAIPDGDKEYKEHGSSTRNTTIGGLQPTTDYIVCVTAIGVDWPIGETVCDNVKTMEPGASKPKGDNTLTIALSCSLAVLVVAAIIIVVIVVKRKKQNKKKPSGFANGYVNNAMGVRVGGESKRFSKPRRDTVYFQNKDNANAEHKLEGFSRDERDQILGMVSQNGASTLSMVSNASSHRYVRELPEIPGQKLSFYNPAMSNDDLDRHVYCEIPGEGAYQEIPDSFI